MSRSRERYANNPEYREVMRKRSKVQYWSKRPEIVRPPLKTIQTEFYTELTITNPTDVDFGKKVVVPFYSISAVARLLDVSPATVRKLEERGWLPKPILYSLGNAEDMAEKKEVAAEAGEVHIPGRPIRGYTYDQVRVMWELYPLLNFPPKREYVDGKKVREAIPEYYYRLTQEWKKMPDGLKVIPK